MVRAWREPDFVADQEGRQTWSDLHDVGPTPSGAKSAASRRDMAKILHLGVANPRWREAPPSASLLDLKHFRSYHAPNHECRLVLEARVTRRAASRPPCHAGHCGGDEGGRHDDL